MSIVAWNVEEDRCCAVIVAAWRSMLRGGRVIALDSASCCDRARLCERTSIRSRVGGAGGGDPAGNAAGEEAEHDAGRAAEPGRAAAEQAGERGARDRGDREPPRRGIGD